MFCRKCGNQIPNDSLFCTQCGAAVKTDNTNRNKWIADEVVLPNKQKPSVSMPEKSNNETKKNESGSNRIYWMYFIILSIIALSVAGPISLGVGIVIACFSCGKNAWKENKWSKVFVMIIISIVTLAVCGAINLEKHKFR